MSLEHKIELGPSEKVLFEVHSYGLTLWWRYALGFLFLALAAFVSLWLFRHGVWGEVGFVLLMSGGLYMLFFTRFTHHSNGLIVTSERLVDVTRSSWFNESTTSLSFHDLGECSAEKRGVWSRVFNYGSLYLDTADGRLRIEVPRVRAPHRFLATLSDHISRYKGIEATKHRISTYEDFLSIIPTLSESELILIEKRVSDRLAYLDNTIEEGAEQMV